MVDVLYFENTAHYVQKYIVRYINDSVCSKICVVKSSNVTVDEIFREKKNSIRKRIRSQN